MSHCTQFEFQYTNRVMICRTFKTLNLVYRDDVVCFYNSSICKMLGVMGKDHTPAIIAEKNGFQYFMLNKGKYYELLMEKHNMTYKEKKIADKMADEFKRLYIAEVAKEVITQMNNKGENAILEENMFGYTIKFGQMYDKNILIKFENGRVIEEVKGVRGQSCVSLTESLENMLSSSDVELQSEWTEEYYESSDNELTIYNMDLQ